MAPGTQIGTYEGHKPEYEGVVDRMTRHPEITAIDWSPDGKYVVSGSAQNSVLIWSTASGKTVFTYKGHLAPIKHVAWSPNGLFIASYGGTRVIRIDEPPRFKFVTDTGRYTLATKIWEARTGRNVQDFEYAGPIIGGSHALRWTTDSIHISLAGLNHGFWGEFSCINREYKCSKLGAPMGYRNSYPVWTGDEWLFIGDGQMVKSSLSGSFAVVDQYEKLRVAYTGQRSLFVQRSVTAAAFSSSQGLVATANGGSLHLWDIETGKTVCVCSNGGGILTFLEFSPNGKLLAGAGQNNVVKIWNAETGRLILTYSRHKGNVGVFAWSPEGNRIASGDSKGIIHVWQAV